MEMKTGGLMKSHRFGLMRFRLCLEWRVRPVLSGDDFRQNIHIHIIQFIDVETGNRFLMLAEFGVEFVCAFELVADVEGDGRLAG